MLPDEPKCIAETCPGGAMREATPGRGRFDLVSFIALARIAVLAEEGAKKYAPNNWRKGMPAWRFIDSALRHLTRYALGSTDEDHLAACAWNIMSLMEQETRIEIGELPADLTWEPMK